MSETLPELLPSPRERWHPSYEESLPDHDPGPWVASVTTQVRYASIPPEWVDFADFPGELPPATEMRFNGGPDLVSWEGQFMSRTAPDLRTRATSVPQYPTALEVPWASGGTDSYGFYNFYRYQRGFLDRPDIWNSEEVRQ